VLIGLRAMARSRQSIQACIHRLWQYRHHPSATVFLRVLLIFTLTRGAFYVAAFTGSWLLPPIDEPAMVDVNARQAVAMHWRWDAVYYYNIAVGGYQVDALAAFFPLFPVLVRGLSFVLGGFQLSEPFPIQEAASAPLIAGIVVAHSAAFIAFVLLFVLTRDVTGDGATAERAVLYAAIYPWAYHYATPYTEGLFLAITAGAFLAMRRRQWLLAGVLVALASATRVTGVLLVIPLIIEIARAWRSGTLSGRRSHSAAAGLLIAPLGLTAYIAYLWWRVGDPLAFIHAQAEWDRQRTFPLTTLYRGIDYAIHRGLTADADVYARGVIHLLFTLAILGIVIVSVKHWPLSWVLYSVALFTVVLSSPVDGPYAMHDLGRYLMILFPIYVTLGRWGRAPMINIAILLLFLPLFSLFAAFYVRWYPA
jgi:Gpi18-like mannosyltransferase